MRECFVALEQMKMLMSELEFFTLAGVMAARRMSSPGRFFEILQPSAGISVLVAVG